MNELDRSSEPVYSHDFDLDGAVAKAKREDAENANMRLHLSEDVVEEIAARALSRVEAVVPSGTGRSMLGLGRKNPEGVKISLNEKETETVISVDAYVKVRYGKRIPDVAWDLQEFLKNELERSTGYRVDSVNIYVEGVYFDDAEKDGNETPGARDTSDSENKADSAAGD